MSSNLLWAPVVLQNENVLPYQLKRVISRKLWDTDGSCGSGKAVMTTDDLPYCLGLLHAGVEGAQELIDALEKHGAIELWHEH